MRPSRIWRALLWWSLPPDRREELDADLTEELSLRYAEESPAAARRWYRRQALGFAAHRLHRAVDRAGRVARRWHPSRWLSATDVRVALRLAGRHPVASVTAILALATAIALALTGFVLARGLAWPELPIEGGDRLYYVLVNRAGRGVDDASPREVLAWMEGAETPEDLGAFQGIVPPVQVAEDEPGRPAEGSRVTPGPFARLAPAPLLGRHLNDSDALPGAEPVVVLRERLWRHRSAFNGDPDVVGRTVRLGGIVHTVVGILPEEWSFPTAHDLWTPLPLQEMVSAQSAAPDAPASRLGTWVLLPETGRPGPVADELETLARSVATGPDDAELTVSVVPYVEGLSEGTGTPIAVGIMTLLLALLTGIGLNVSTLVLARCAQRADELAVRAALGAPRSRLVVQLFVEALVVGGMAAVLGTFAAHRVLEWARPYVDQDLPFWMDLSMDPAVVVFAVLLAILASGVVGVVPALRITGRNRAAAGLTGGSARLTPVALGRLTGALLVLQLAVAVGILSVAGLLVEGLGEYAGKSRIPDEDRVLTALLRRNPPMPGEEAGREVADLHRYRTAIEAELAAIPGADKVAVAGSLPRFHDDFATIELEASTGEPHTRHRVQTVHAGPGFFEVLGHAPLQGRSLLESDAVPDARPVAVVSESFAAEVLGGRSPVGRRFRLTTDEDPAAAPWVEIVGVVPHVGMDPGSKRVRSEVYLPLVGRRWLYAMVRADGDPMALAPALRRAVAEVDPAALVTDVQALPDVGWEIRAFLRGGTGVLSIVGAFALLLSLASVYALASLSVTSRTREIGIRVALGASPREVLRAVLHRTLIQLGLGAMAGAGLALALGRVTLLLPFEIPRSVGVTVPLVIAAMLLAGLLAAWVPARRALRVAPMDALRAQ